MNCVKRDQYEQWNHDSTSTSRDNMRTRWTTLGAAARDNFMEWFDFTLYGFFAAAIGLRCFPADDPLRSTMARHAAFAAGVIST